MQYYVKEESNHSALLIAEDGYILCSSDSVQDAVNLCILECGVAPIWIDWNKADNSPQYEHSTLLH